jgi:hypothetical protein
MLRLLLAGLVSRIVREGAGELLFGRTFYTYGSLHADVITTQEPFNTEGVTCHPATLHAHLHKSTHQHRNNISHKNTNKNKNNKNNKNNNKIMPPTDPDTKKRAARATVDILSEISTILVRHVLSVFMKKTHNSNT